MIPGERNIVGMLRALMCKNSLYGITVKDLETVNNHAMNAKKACAVIQKIHKELELPFSILGYDWSSLIGYADLGGRMDDDIRAYVALVLNQHMEAKGIPQTDAEVEELAKTIRLCDFLQSAVDAEGGLVKVIKMYLKNRK